MNRQKRSPRMILTQRTAKSPARGGIRALDSKFKICAKKLTNFRIYYKALTNFRICYKALTASLILFLPLTGFAPLFAQEQVAVAKKEYPPGDAAVTPTSPIKIDGRLDEEAWQKRPCWEFLLRTDAGAMPSPPRSRPKCSLLTTRRKFISASAASTPSCPPDGRDAVDKFMDDHISFMLDTFNDERRRVNRWECRPMPNSANSKAMRIFPGTPSGHRPARSPISVVEVAIPFNQLRFPKGGAELTMGFEADRGHAMPGTA